MREEILELLKEFFDFYSMCEVDIQNHRFPPSIIKVIFTLCLSIRFIERPKKT